MSEPSIFTKIINGDIPSHKIYEDERTLAFLDIHPAAEGHTLVIPKAEVEFVWDLSEEDYRALMATVQKVALRLREVTGKPYVGEMIVGTDVPHAHVHLVAFDQPQELKRTIEPSTAEPHHEALKIMSDKLRFG